MSIKPMLAKPYKGSHPVGWFLSEKLDGVRVIWDGERFLSRNGNEFPAPQGMADAMPCGVVLDGEMFGGRGKFQETCKRVRAGDWDGLRFMIFDIVNGEEFEARQWKLKGLNLPAFCEPVKQSKCLSLAHLDQFEEDVLSAGGEGVMLRAPGSAYDHGRSGNLLKLKQFEDAEATVVGYIEGKGRNEGGLGALVVEWAGKVFRVGSGLTDAVRAWPPFPGMTITFSYFDLTDSGKPRFPTFVSVRDYE